MFFIKIILSIKNKNKNILYEQEPEKYFLYYSTSATNIILNFYWYESDKFNGIDKMTFFESQINIALFPI